MSKLTTTKHLLLAIMDFVIIGIVIYGLNDWVYDGYPVWVPYAIMVFFLVMAAVRFYKFSYTLKKSNSLDSHDLESLFAEDGSQDEQSEGTSAKGFRRRNRKTVARSTENKASE